MKKTDESTIQTSLTQRGPHVTRRRFVGDAFALTGIVFASLNGLTACGSSSSDSDGGTTGTATSSTSAEDSVTTVRLGDQPSFYLLKIAEAKGFFADEFDADGIGIQVNNFVNQGSAVVEAMNAGDIDLGLIGSLPLVTADANGSNFKALSSANYSENGFKLVATKDSGISSISNLRGKKVGVKFSSNEHQMVLTLLENAGFTTSDVEVVNMSSSDSLNSVLDGSVAAACLNPSQAGPAEQAGLVAIADNSESGLISNFVIGRQKFLEENPTISQRVLKVLDKTAKWIDENQDETIQIFVDQTKTDADSARASLESRKRSISVEDRILKDPIQQSIDFTLNQNLISGTITTDDIIDTSYFEGAGLGNGSN